MQSNGKIDYRTRSRPGKILVLKDVAGIYAHCRPVMSQIYPAEIVTTYHGSEFCVVPVGDMRIVLRRNRSVQEYLELPSHD